MFPSPGHKEAFFDFKQFDLKCQHIITEEFEFKPTWCAQIKPRERLIKADVQTEPQK
jgi:hypothetical protein